MILDKINKTKEDGHSGSGSLTTGQTDRKYMLITPPVEIYWNNIIKLTLSYKNQVLMQKKMVIPG